MKKILLLLIIFSFFNVLASSGKIREDSIISCNGIYYGSHGNPVHWHIVKKDGENWVINGGEVNIPPCYIRPVSIKEKVIFSKCVDGDTAKFIINKEEKIVRFLAIDTPESVKKGQEVEPFGKEASEYTCNALKSAKKIVLEYDKNSDREDKYGRVLAFVFVDNELLEKELIKNGLAKVEYIYGDYNYVDELRKEEEVAKTKKIGIWSSNDNLPDKNESIIKYENVIKVIKKIYKYVKKLFDLFLK